MKNAIAITISTLLNFFRFTRGKNDGFSLVGVMVAAAILGGLSMTIMKLTSQQAKVQKTAETNFEVRSLSSEISQLLLSSESCKNTFDDLGSIQSATSVPAIKTRNDDNKISVGDTFNNNIEIIDMELREQDWGPPSAPSNHRFGEGMLYVTFEKMSDMAQGGNTVQESFPLKFDVDSSYNVLRCYGATENAVDTSKEESCELIGGNYNSNTDSCNLFPYEDTSPDRETAVSTKYLDDYIGGTLDDRYVNVGGDTMTGALTVEDDITLNSGGDLSVSSGDEICIGGNCRSTFATQSCSAGEVIMEINSNGTVQCANVTCPDSAEFYVGINGSGNVICKPFPTETCPTDHYVTKVYDDGSVDCKEVPETEKISGQNCSAGDVVTGIDNNGNLNCSKVSWGDVTSKPSTATRWPNWGEVNNKPGSDSCPSGQYVTSVNFSNGSVNCEEPSSGGDIKVCLRCQFKGGAWDKTACQSTSVGGGWSPWWGYVNETRHNWRRCKIFIKKL